MSNQWPNAASPAAADAVAAFAAQLRKLRADAGSPSFRQLAKTTHYSSSTLAEATAGRRLPTEAVVKAFAEACGADGTQWLRLLQDAAAAASAASLEAVRPALADGAVFADQAQAADSIRAASRRGEVAIAAVSFIVGAALTAAVFLLVDRPNGSPRVVDSLAPIVSSIPSAVPSARVADGADPAAAGCAKDAVLVDRSPVMIDGVQVGALDLEYSAYCDAGWARIYLYPGQHTMLGGVSVDADDGRSEGFTDPLIRQISPYTNVIVLAPGGCLGAHADFYDVGHRPAGASIRCQAPRK